MHLEILDLQRKEILNKLGFLSEAGFYLAGGTALALQIGHRTSLDFDFYADKKFDARKLREECEKRFSRVREIYLAADSLELDVDGIKISFFYYPYRLIKPVVAVEEGVSLASKEDIAAMKILAISQRGKRRDFIDIYFLIKEFNLPQILEFTKEKYPMFNIYVGLQGLIYFADADEDAARERFWLLAQINWQQIKDYLIKEINQIKKTL